MDWRWVEMVGIKDVHNYSSDNFALQARILQRQTRCHGSYLWGHRAFPLSLPAPEDFRPTDRKFQEMKAMEPNPPPTTCSPRPQWIQETLIRLIGECDALPRNPQHNRDLVRNLTNSIRRSLLVHSRRREEKSAEDIGACLEPATGNIDIRGAYVVLKRWYCHAPMRDSNNRDQKWPSSQGVILHCTIWKNQPPPEDRCLPTSNPSGSMMIYPRRVRLSQRCTSSHFTRQKVPETSARII